MSPTLSWIIVIGVVVLAMILALALAKVASLDPLDSGEVDVVVDEFAPNERCVDCGLQVEQNHHACQGHQWCLAECPRCGGELVEIPS